jgi:2-haloacid dehalogenase
MDRLTTLIAFDAYGTLFDVSAAINRHAAAVGDDAAAVSALWRTKQLEYSWTLTLMNRYEDFWELTQKALDFALTAFPSVDPALRSVLLAAYRELDAYPDVIDTLTLLKERGHRLAVFTNGTLPMVTAALSSAGIDHLPSELVSIDSIRRYKTSPEAYQLLCDRLSATPEQITLVSSNRWDIAGARSFGLQAIWCNRGGAPDEYQSMSPTMEVTSLKALLTS